MSCAKMTNNPILRLGEDALMRHTVRCIALLIPLLLTLAFLFTATIVFAAAVGDQVELKATHQAGIPFHKAPGGGQMFQRVRPELLLR
jgi:hypothetical protein